MIYLDYAANTPVEEEILREFVEINRRYIGNPNSLHPMGIEARDKLDDRDIDCVSFTPHKYFGINGGGVLVKRKHVVLEPQICISTKSACSVPNLPSRPVYAVTKNKKNAKSSFRISMSHRTTEEEIDKLILALQSIYFEVVHEKI